MPFFTKINPNCVWLFRCDICNTQFESHRRLTKHLDNTHGKEVGELDCTFCDRPFKSKSSLSRHLRVHKKQEQVEELQLQPVCEDEQLIISDIDETYVNSDNAQFMTDTSNIIRIALLGIDGDEGIIINGWTFCIPFAPKKVLIFYWICTIELKTMLELFFYFKMEFDLFWWVGIVVWKEIKF